MLILLLVLALVPALLFFACGDDSEKGVLQQDDDGGGGGSNDDDEADDDAADDDTSDDDTTSESIDLLIIYNYDTGIVGKYENALENDDIQVHSMHEDDVTSGNFTGIDVILIDTDTDWFSATAINEIRHLGIPLLGVYYGGGALFDGLGKEVGWSGGDTDNSEYQVIVQEPTHSVFNIPYDLGVLELSTLTVFTYSVRMRYHDMLPSPPLGVVLLAEKSGGTAWSAITLEDGDTIYWGFEMNPDYLAESGRKLLVNCIHYLSTK